MFTTETTCPYSHIPVWEGQQFNAINMNVRMYYEIWMYIRNKMKCDVKKQFPHNVKLNSLNSS